MKTTFLFVLVAALAVTCTSSVIKASSARAGLNAGWVAAGDKLLYRTYVYQPPIANTIQYQDVSYRGNTTTRVTAVQATEVGYTQYASVWIIAGGIGRNNVTVRVQSSRGYGYYYLLDIWGR